MKQIIFCLHLHFGGFHALKMFETRSLVRTFRNLHSDVNRKISAAAENMNSFGFQALFRLPRFMPGSIGPRAGRCRFAAVRKEKIKINVKHSHSFISRFRYCSKLYVFAHSVSPRYSPAEADVLVNVIKEYFDLI